MAARTRNKKSIEPTDKVLSLLNMPEGHLILEMGMAYKYHDVPSGIKFKADYLKLGKEMWSSAQHDLHMALCEGKYLKEDLGDFLNGNNTRELCTALLTLFIAQFSAPLSVAIPATAMVIKLGLTKFCSKKPSKRSISIKELLLKQKARRSTKK